MGLGKTIQSYCRYAGGTRGWTLPSLIVAPATLLENWRRELAQFAPRCRSAFTQGQRGQVSFLGLRRTTWLSLHTILLCEMNRCFRRSSGT
ncbi:MAG: hypothetical protein IPG64_06000 [Haliea sp.]|nr:hypothetical protein [Haliea sp.]